MEPVRIGIVGNPNCGKSTLFNILTGAKQRVGNWPGVTVDRKTGSCHFQGQDIEVVDTPGIYSLAASSLDEKITRDFVLSREAELIVNIVDASNIERNLYLTTQLLEMKAPLIIALNMMDMAKEKQLVIDVKALEERLGCPVVPMTASENKGIEELKTLILATAGTREIASIAKLVYPAAIQEARAIVAAAVHEACLLRGLDADWLALKLLENDTEAKQYVPIGPKILGTVSQLQEQIEESEDEEADILIASARYNFISWLLQGVLEKKGHLSETLSDRIDRLVLSRVLGIPIFLAAMYVMFMFTINLGGAFIDFFDQFAGAIFVDGFSALLEMAGAPEWLILILAKGAGGGIQTMATFIPPIGFMFLFLSFLEDSGYMARAAFVMDRFMRFIGLPGKAFVPMLVGFGCNVPAIMATRTLDNERDRILTIMMNPFMSCGARFPVYALFAVVFFSAGGQNMVFLLYLIGIAFAVLTGLILKNTLLKGEITPFVMEMPPYHLPTVRSVLLRAYDRLKSFLFRAGRVLIPVIMVLTILNTVGMDGSYNNEDSENSILASMSKTITPVFAPMGISEENWPATVGIFTGIFAKEAVVGTLDSLYTAMDEREAAGAEGVEEEAFNFAEAIKESFATIPANLKDMVGTFTDPLGISLGETADRTAAAEEQEVNLGTLDSMSRLFGSQSAAFAYLLFILLYFPCSAAIAAVYRETNLAWTAFVGFWTTFLAYLASTAFYQTANFSAHPEYSAVVIGADLCAFVVVVLIMWMGSRRARLQARVPANAGAAA